MLKFSCFISPLFLIHLQGYKISMIILVPISNATPIRWKTENSNDKWIYKEDLWYPSLTEYLHYSDASLLLRSALHNPLLLFFFLFPQSFFIFSLHIIEINIVN